MTFTPAEFITFQDGKSAASALAAGGSLEAKYKVVQGDATIDVGVAKQFQESYEYGLFDFHNTMYSVDFVGENGYQEDVAEDKLLWAVHRLPPFNPRQKDTVRAYRDLFSQVGTHVIIGATYGARLTFVSLLPQ